MGSGIVGASLAAELALHDECSVTVIDQAPAGDLLPDNATTQPYEGYEAFIGP